MRRFLLSLLLGRVRVAPMRWQDRRTLLQKSDADLIERRARCVQRRPADAHIAHNPEFIPPFLRLEPPSILRRQAA